MSGKDHYYNRAKVEGYRARSAFKLKQIDAEMDLLGGGQTVVDLGAAPGGWLEVAVEAVGDSGTVIGVDRQRIDPVEGCETIRGDITDEDTVSEIRETVGGDAHVVLSDMAPNMTGEYGLDHARSVHLAEQAFAVAQDLLGSGGRFVVKVFDGPDLADFRERVEGEFASVRAYTPDASRDSSSELYLVGRDFLTAPIRAGDELTVEIESVGSEGDGVAKVEEFTVFVPDTEVGETVEIVVRDVKPRFAFAERT